MPIHPQEIFLLLNRCPICEDIQLKIFMLVIGINGTPTSNLFKAPTIFTFYTTNRVFNYSTTPLKPSAYFRDLVLLANYKFMHCDDDEEDGEEEEEENPNLSCETGYELNMAYTLTYGDEMGNEYIDYMVKLKEITKNRLNKLIETEPII
jgi:hypothetical protein